MSSEAPAQRKTSSTIVRILVLTAIAITVLAIQVGLPWLCYRWAIDQFAQSDESSFWLQRLRFVSLYEPNAFNDHRRRMSSAVVCDDEVIVLYDDGEIVRVHLRTGRITTDRAPQGVEDVLSDGRSLWWLPRHPEHLYPFIWQGRPTAIVRSTTDADLWKLTALVDGIWRETDRYVLLPRGHAQYRTFTIGEDAVALLRVMYSDNLFTRRMSVGSQAEAQQFADRHPDNILLFSEERLREVGWHRVHLLPTDRVFLDRKPAYWIEEETLCSIATNEEASGDGRSVRAIEVRRDTGDLQTERKLIALPAQTWDDYSPLGWDWNERAPQLRIAIVGDGRVCLVKHHDRDDRLHILSLESGQLRLVAQRGSPLIRWVCLDGGLFLGLAIVLPMLLLGLLIGMVEYRHGQRGFAFGHETVVLASTVRRGMARIIDLVVVLLPFVLSIVCHSDVMGWWQVVARHTSQMSEQCNQMLVDPSLSSLTSMIESLHEILPTILAAPVLWRLFVPGVLIGVGLLLWQGRSGRTLGKWLCGVRLLRTTLRPCGLARSLLREILLVIDSLLLLSWVPGVIVMVATRHSQRVGDLLADTIVVREPARRTEPLLHVPQ